jgi:adenylate cyclase
LVLHGAEASIGQSALAANLSGTATGERRLVSVLYADMAGYSRLLGLDDVGTLARLRALRSDIIDPAISEYAGRIVQTGGDSLLIVFDSIEGAVRCALQVQQQLPDCDKDQPPDRAIRFRMGIAIGDAIAEGTDLHGDGVIIAARLQAECPPGSICVSRAVRDHVHDRLDLAFDSLGPLNLKNVARPVEAYVLRPAASAGASGSARTLLAGNTIETLPLPDRPSIAVLAFTNMSGDAEQEYFADGISEDIITSLSQIRWLFVIARNSSFTYKGRAVDLKHVGRELGVRYVLEGSVRRAGDQLRITAQLIDAPTGAHAWAERYDRSLADVFAIQDEITTSVVNAIDSVLAATERQRVGRLPADRLSTWELYHRGMWHFYRLTADDRKLALSYLHQAEAADPGWATAHTGLAVCYMVGGWIFAPAERSSWIAQGIEHARLAINLNPRDAEAHTILGVGLGFSGHHESSIECSMRAAELNPTNAWIRAVLGGSFVYGGRPGEGLPHLEAAMRLSPLDPLRWIYSHIIATGYFFYGNYEASLNAGKSLIKMQPDIWFGYRHCCAALAELGQIDEARYYVDQLYSRFAMELTSWMGRWGEWREPDHARYKNTLAKAGLVLQDGVLARIDGGSVRNGNPQPYPDDKL